MKELDFDELDRAVSSLIGDTNKTPAETAASPTNPAVVQPAVTTVSSDDTSVIPGLVTPVQPLAARRSSGRFMDVVHPSSDMRSAPQASDAPISRTGVTVAAPSGIEQEPVPEPTLEPVSWTPFDLRKKVSEKPNEVEVPQETEPASSEWPDPLDFHGFKDDEPASLAADPVLEKMEATPHPFPVVETAPTPEATADEDDDINAIADEINHSLNDDEPVAPLETPFLSDAKVEKRPLGAFSTELTAVVAEPVVPVTPEVVIPEVIETPMTQLPTDDSKEISDGEDETPLPAELQGDLLSIESSEALPSTATQSPAEVAQPTGPASISQQYKEQPSSGDQSTVAIYDTEAYHKPLAHPAKKSSGWHVVLWILVAAIIGGGGGLAVYFYGLPLLSK